MNLNADTGQLIAAAYGLALFSLGVALRVANCRDSDSRLARAIRPLSWFGLLAGLQVWLNTAQTGSIAAAILLAAAYLCLLAFGLVLLSPSTRRNLVALAVLAAIWGATTAIATRLLPEPVATLATGAAHITLGLPGAMVATWALMVQQRTFREKNMPQFGRDLVWCAVTMLVYGLLILLFATPSTLAPAAFINSDSFLRWFGMPVQLAQTGLILVFSVFLVRALKAFEHESRRQLAAANQAKFDAQAAALAAQRQSNREMEQLNQQLQQVAHDLTILLDLSNLLTEPLSLHEQLQQVLDKIILRLNFADAGIIFLNHEETGAVTETVAIGLNSLPPDKAGVLRGQARELGIQCVARKLALCRHLDGSVIEFSLEDAIRTQRCRKYISPTLMVALPLAAQNRIIGSLLLLGPEDGSRRVSVDEFVLMVGIAQQLGLSVENARLYQGLQKREKRLAEMLNQVVDAQEAERRRIARELHDATAQSLTAIALGLSGLESLMAGQKPLRVEQVRELQNFSTSALAELRGLIADLRPSHLDDLGLAAALRWYLQTFEKRYGIATKLAISADINRLSSDYETVLFRILQEALTNVAKHAHATAVKVTLDQQPGNLHLAVEDNGQGFDLDAVLHNAEIHKGWGLLGIQERAALLGASCKIDTAPGQGTLIGVNVPLTKEITDAEKDKTTAG
ncbi:MAG: hypothetical protein Kow0031_37420 [Anaerolineae bacterium]